MCSQALLARIKPVFSLQTNIKQKREQPLPLPFLINQTQIYEKKSIKFNASPVPKNPATGYQRLNKVEKAKNAVISCSLCQKTILISHSPIKKEMGTLH
jgi:hypothetical protein